VEKTISRPLRYKGIPVKHGVSFLLKQNIQETRKIQRKAKNIIKTFLPAKTDYKVQDIKPHFILISKKVALIAKRQEEINNAQMEIDFISSWERFPRAVHVFGENKKKALRRGVKIRVILEKPEKMDQIPEQIHEFEKDLNYELRYILKPPNAIVGIFDKKIAMLKTSASVDLADAPSLWTDNPCLLSILSDYFEIMWITALTKRRES
jgi:hypothetical protein